MSTLCSTRSKIRRQPAGDMGRNLPDDVAVLFAKRTDRTSWRGLADAAGVSIGAVQRFFDRIGTAEPETVDGLVRALNVTEERLFGLAGRPLEEMPYRPPREAHRLTPKQREAVSAVIRAMVEPVTAARANQVDNVHRLPERPDVPVEELLSGEFAANWEGKGDPPHPGKAEAEEAARQAEESQE